MPPIPENSGAIAARKSRGLGLCLFLLGTVLLAQPKVGSCMIPLQINHQGLVQVEGSPFDGTGLFRFAVIDANAETNLWTNDGTAVGSEGIPANPVSIPVTDGLYSVSLGDASLTGMDPLPSNVFDSSAVLLRIWFDDGTNGLRQLVPDHVLSTVPFSFRARKADIVKLPLRPQNRSPLNTLRLPMLPPPRWMHSRQGP